MDSAPSANLFNISCVLISVSEHFFWRSSYYWVWEQCSTTGKRAGQTSRNSSTRFLWSAIWGKYSTWQTRRLESKESTRSGVWTLWRCSSRTNLWPWLTIHTWIRLAFLRYVFSPFLTFPRQYSDRMFILLIHTYWSNAVGRSALAREPWLFVKMFFPFYSFVHALSISARMKIKSPLGT